MDQRDKVFEKGINLCAREGVSEAEAAAAAAARIEDHEARYGHERSIFTIEFKGDATALRPPYTAGNIEAQIRALRR